MEKFLLPEKFSDLVLDGDTVLSACMTTSNAEAYKHLVRLRLGKTKTDIYFIVQTLERIACSNSKNDKIPYGIDSDLCKLFKTNERLYKKLYKFSNSRYKEIMDNNVYLCKGSYTVDIDNIDEYNMFYGRSFLECIPKILKFQKLPPIKLDKKYIENLFKPDACIYMFNRSELTDELKALAVKVFAK